MGPVYGGREYHSEPAKCKDINDIPGRAHNGMYSQPKKLKKGAGHKKMTRAQRKVRKL